MSVVCDRPGGETPVPVYSDGSRAGPGVSCGTNTILFQTDRTDSENVEDVRKRATARSRTWIYGRRSVLVRSVYLVFATIWYGLTFGGRLGWGSVVVLCYHGIPLAGRRRFEWQMARIAERGVATQDLPYARAYRCGSKPGVCVTFDDAFANLLENALPVTRQLGVPATVFAVAGNLGAKPGWTMPCGHPESDEVVMSAEQVRRGVQDGLFCLGSHTMTHPDLTKIPPVEARHEIVESKAALEKIGGVPVGALAFPHGAYNAAIVEMAEAAGYTHVFTLEPKVYAARDGARVGRFSMSPDVWRLEFLLTCAGAYSWLSALRRLVAAGRAWLRVRGA